MFRGLAKVGIVRKQVFTKFRKITKYVYTCRRRRPAATVEVFVVVFTVVVVVVGQLLQPGPFATHFNYESCRRERIVRVVLLHNGRSCNACTIKRSITLLCIPKQST
jgi:hypothetical protein